MESEQKVINLRIDEILPNRFQPRIRFDETAINELSESIKEHGVIQPIIVREIGDKYEIIAGERRYKASVMAGKETIPAIIKNLNDQDSAEVALIENVQRRDLTPIEEAVSYRKILDMGYLTQEGLAAKLDKSQSTIANKLRLLNLHDSVQEALLEEKISERHARSLLKMPTDQQEEMLNRIITERLTVRQTDNVIDELLGTEKELEKVENIDAYEEGEKQMDNEQNNIFNIPSEPIIEESNVNVQQEAINPGFVNIEAIEQNATDIYNSDLLESQPNIDLLLHPQQFAVEESEINELENQNDFFGQTNVIRSQDITNNETSDEESSFRPGRFFGVEESEDNYLTDTSLNEFTDNTLLNDENSNNIVNSNLNENDVFAPELDINVKDFNNFNNSEFNTTESIVENVENNNNEIPEINDLDNIFIEPEIIDFEESSLPEQTEEVTPQYSPHYTFDDFEDLPEISGGFQSEEPETRNESDLRIAINTVRDLTKILENQGYIIDTDEIDFEDSYQFIIKISK